ncbi:CDC48 family AAA ATPase [Halanaeroarchaeum sulfurireducens]|uniref:Cell division control protein 48 n=1 Tax=Halanaeroarchaeum sulfurireducens TaxID=1604004 RepID=A0A0F7PD67_9EURY|nr:CDC48 family AAA ATPase [Halanaeroarchaeum sulfurireducens]AKH98125.1 cell division control protein 48 [Halanaeroarchaeum sulfurireducens]
MHDGRGREARVLEAHPRDAGRGTVRLSRALLQDLGVLSGEAVRIEGDRSTVATVWPGRSDLDADAIRVDGQIRANAGVSVGERVTVAPAAAEQAERVVLAPTVALSREEVDIESVVERALLDRPVDTGERVKVDGLGDLGEFLVQETEPAGPVRITESTTVVVSSSEADPESPGDSVGVTYEDVGGLDDELEQVRELVEVPLSEPGVFHRLGIEPPKGVLMHGPPGTGKTLIARAVANEADAHFEHVSGPEIVRKYKGESEERLREIFETAEEQAPSIVFFDEIDAVAPKREDGGDMESRVVGQLLSLLDGLESRGEVVVIGATNRVDTLDPALRRPGRFDREVEIGVPDAKGRAEILHVHTRGTPLADDVDVDRIAERAHGFVGADLRALVVEAAMSALRRGREEGTEDVAVTRRDFERALSGVEPSAMREYVAELPETSFDDVGGLTEAKATLREAIEWPLTHKDLFEAAATDPPTGVLLYGPPGTGKSLLARAIAHESGVNVIRVAGPEILDRYVGESERAVREVFERARQAAPAIVFFDEIDAIAGARGDGRHEVSERVVSQLLSEMDSAADDPNLIVLAATNRKDAIDPALLRPGRLEEHVDVPAPDRPARIEILRVHAREKPLGDDVDFATIAGELDGYTGADIAALVRRASMRAIRDVAERRETDDAGHDRSVTVGMDHFRAAMATIDATAR